MFASARTSKLDPFREVEGFAEPKVDPLECRASQLIPALVAEGSRGWGGKRSLIEPLVRTAVLQLRVPDNIGKPLKIITTQRVRVGAAGHDCTKGLTALNDDRGGKLPTAHDRIEQDVVVQELLVFPERQLVNSIAPECVPKIEVGVPIVRRRNKGVLDVLGAPMASPTGSVNIIQEVGPDVAELKLRPWLMRFSMIACSEL